MRIRPSKKGGRYKTLHRHAALAKLAQALLAMHSHPEDLIPWCLVSVIVINVIDHYSMLFLCQALPNIPRSGGRPCRRRAGGGTRMGLPRAVCAGQRKPIVAIESSQGGRR